MPDREPKTPTLKISLRISRGRIMAHSKPIGMDDFEAEDDLRTLKRAVEIKKDKKRMSAASKVVDKEMAAISEVRAGFDPEDRKRHNDMVNAGANSLKKIRKENME